MSYYNDEVSKLNPLERLSVKFFSESDYTKTMDINKESIDTFIAFLQTYKSIIMEDK